MHLSIIKNFLLLLFKIGTSKRTPSYRKTETAENEQKAQLQTQTNRGKEIV